MLNLEVKTKLSVEETIGRLKSYFGKGGFGLEIKDENEACLNFEGSGGYVTATVCEDGRNTKVELVGQEWEIQMKNFASKLPR
ncbi:MAG: hypothetical protein V3V37_02005 [Candidatus Adiutricales bacterium]